MHGGKPALQARRQNCFARLLSGGNNYKQQNKRPDKRAQQPGFCFKLQNKVNTAGRPRVKGKKRARTEIGKSRGIYRRGNQIARKQEKRARQNPGGYFGQRSLFNEQRKKITIRA